MDPLSITAGCVALTATVTKLGDTITRFVRDVRAARADLDAISRELGSLKLILLTLEDEFQDELLDEASQPADDIPEALKKQIQDIIRNCQAVLRDIDSLLEKQTGSRVGESSKWVLVGRADVRKSQTSLEAHRSALDLALELVTMHTTNAIKKDTTEIAQTTREIKTDTELILLEIERLRNQLPMQDRNNLMLDRYLDQLTSYAESAINDDAETWTADTAEVVSLLDNGSINSHGVDDRRWTTPVGIPVDNENTSVQRSRLTNGNVSVSANANGHQSRGSHDERLVDGAGPAKGLSRTTEALVANNQDMDDSNIELPETDQHKFPSSVRRDAQHYYESSESRDSFTSRQQKSTPLGKDTRNHSKSINVPRTSKLRYNNRTLTSHSVEKLERDTKSIVDWRSRKATTDLQNARDSTAYLDKHRVYEEERQVTDSWEVGGITGTMSNCSIASYDLKCYKVLAELNKAEPSYSGVRGSLLIVVTAFPQTLEELESPAYSLFPLSMDFVYGHFQLRALSNMLGLEAMELCLVLHTYGTPRSFSKSLDDLGFKGQIPRTAISTFLGARAATKDLGSLTTVVPYVAIYEHELDLKAGFLNDRAMAANVGAKCTIYTDSISSLLKVKMDSSILCPSHDKPVSYRLKKGLFGRLKLVECE